MKAELQGDGANLPVWLCRKVTFLLPGLWELLGQWLFAWEVREAAAAKDTWPGLHLKGWAQNPIRSLNTKTEAHCWCQGAAACPADSPAPSLAAQPCSCGSGERNCSHHRQRMNLLLIGSEDCISSPSAALSPLIHVLFPSVESCSSWLPKDSVNNLFGRFLLQIILSSHASALLSFPILAPAQHNAEIRVPLLHPEQHCHTL